MDAGVVQKWSGGGFGQELTYPSSAHYRKVRSSARYLDINCRDVADHIVLIVEDCKRCDSFLIKEKEGVTERLIAAAKVRESLSQRGPRILNGDDIPLRPNT